MATAVAAMTMMIMMMMIVVDGDLTTSHPLSSFGFTNETVSTTNGPVLGEIVGLSSDKPIYSYKRYGQALLKTILSLLLFRERTQT